MAISDHLSNQLFMCDFLRNVRIVTAPHQRELTLFVLSPTTSRLVVLRFESVNVSGAARQ